MRMLFTDEHPLINLIQGHTIISDPKLYRSSYIDPDDPETSDYPLKRILYEQCVDVVFMVDWFRVYGGKTIGFHAAHHRSWRQTLKNKHVICVVQDDPFVWETWFGRKVRRCIATPASSNLYITNCPTSAEAVKKRGNVTSAVFSEDDPEDALAMIEGIISRKVR
tara:strand:- start:273 stop:767 length:495 start_codon:yes stop_codon:yes gene_type:complete